MAEDVRAVVVGGGVMGAAAAWRLAQRGVDVTVLEQFGPGHERGASHGSSRIFRLAYADARYVHLAERAYAGWRDLERAAGAEVLTITGAVDHGDPTQRADLHSTLTEAGAEAGVLSAVEAQERFPGLHFEGDVLWHQRAGRLHADRAVAALGSAARALGADLRHHVEVAAIDVGHRCTVVTTSGERLGADVVVVAAGAWSRRLLGSVELPDLRVTVEQPAHFAPRSRSTPWPSFIHHPVGDDLGSGGAAVYGLGSDDGVKVGFHKVGAEIDPDAIDRPIDGARLAALQDYVRTWVPGVDPGSAAPLTCTYTLTPDEHPVVDRSGPVTVLAGFSGHGFKFAPAIGDLAADLALTGCLPQPHLAFGRRVAVPAPPVIR